MKTIDLSGKVALVTGGGSGIGLGIALALGEAGAKVGIAEINLSTGDAACATCSQRGVEAFFVHTDVSDEHSVRNLVAVTLRTHGRLDILVNCAGHVHAKMYPQFAAMESMAEFDRALAVNYRGAVLCCRAAADALMAVRGCVVNVTSVGASDTLGNGTCYCPTKAALEHFSRCLAREWGPKGVRVNALAPGDIITPGAAVFKPDTETAQRNAQARIPLQRSGTPADVGPCALFLASNLAAYVTGAVLVVDGGWKTM